MEFNKSAFDSAISDNKINKWHKYFADVVKSYLTHISKGQNLPIQNVSVLPSCVDEYRKWKKDNPDEEYQYDEIHDFTSGLSRGDLQELLEYADAR